MTKLRDIDLLSVGVGVVIGMLVLAMAYTFDTIAPLDAGRLRPRAANQRP